MSAPGLPDYRQLDATGEGLSAAARMDARAREPASAALFEALVAPHLLATTRWILEVGCGSGALARRLASALPGAAICACDKSQAMLDAASSHLDPGSAVRLARWDCLDERAFPFEQARFDLIVSSVVVPYLDDAETADLVLRLAARLNPGGTLLLVEQDLHSDSLHMPYFDLWRKIVAKDERNLKPTHCLGLRPLLRAAGLHVAPDRAFLWTEDHYGPYLRDLLGRFAKDALDLHRITAEERQLWLETLEDLSQTNDFWYGLTYHAIAGKLRG